MIELFHIPNYQINTGQFTHYLHGNIVTEFEQSFCQYVGAKYACTFNSATNAIFLSMLNKNTTVTIPSMIPPVVANAILTSGNKLQFKDDIDWIGDSYILHKFKDYKIIDSAQKVEKDQFIKEANDNDLMIFSFYPTKPIGSSDGGIIVSNDFAKIKKFKEGVMNGMSYANNNWERKIKFPGFKMYMNSIQCYIANENFKKLDVKKERLRYVKDIYNKELGYKNTSNHLYRIEVMDNKMFTNKMLKNGIRVGHHYNALHKHSVYKTDQKLLKSEQLESRTVSIPFNEILSDNQIEYIIKQVKKNG